MLAVPASHHSRNRAGPCRVAPSIFMEALPRSIAADKKAEVPHCAPPGPQECVSLVARSPRVVALARAAGATTPAGGKGSSAEIQASAFVISYGTRHRKEDGMHRQRKFLPFIALAATIATPPLGQTATSGVGPASGGHYEGDTLVVDTVGVKTDRPYAMIDLFGTPYSKSLHVVERYRLREYEDVKDLSRAKKRIGCRSAMSSASTGASSCNCS